MNNLTDAEISRRLALAIGWNEMQLAMDWGNTNRLRALDADVGFYRYFDYRDPAVIEPIAERFDCFLWKAEGSWYAATGYIRCESDTAAKAVALAVIKAKEQK